MLFSILESGHISGIIPHSGQSVDDCILEELGVKSMDDVAFVEPKFFTRCRGDLNQDYFGLMMFVRKFPQNCEKNHIAGIVSGHPEKDWTLGTAVIASSRNGSRVHIPDGIATKVGEALRAMQNVKPLPWCTVPQPTESKEEN